MNTDDHDDGPCTCPFCSGDVPLEIVERIKAAAAGPMSEPMTLDEFREWLDSFGREGTIDK